MSRPRFVGRRRPYTASGIQRVPCSRCGRPSAHQWQACANGRRFTALCLRCDVALNVLALRFMRIPGWQQLARRYVRKTLGGRQRGRA